MATVSIKKGSVTLPSPTDIKTSNEIIWSENTGRSPDSGKMSGDRIAEKMTFEVTWSMIKESELESIRKNLPAGFFNVVITIGSKVHSIEAYRSDISSEVAGIAGGELIYRTVSTSIIER